MNRKRQKQIEELALQLLIETGCFEYPPINVYKVAHKKAIEVAQFDFGDEVSGVLVTENGTSTIGININNGDRRKRFTVAHELGHYTLGHQRVGMFIDTPDRYFTIFNFRDSKSSTGEYTQEREANAFAAALLMPEELIRRVIHDLKEVVDIRNEKADLIQELADKFEVSYQAMGFRLSNLGSVW